MQERVRITDVAPRDGLQNEPQFVPTAQKARLVRALAACGLDEIEITSFVSPRWVPQLGDASELCALLRDGKPDGVIFSALVPNRRGIEAVLEVNHAAGRKLLDKVAVFTAASETFALRNTAGSIAQTLERFQPVVALARENGLTVRGYVSCAIACPFEGPVAPPRVIEVAGRLLDLGVDELDVGDTIGAATPETMARLLEQLAAALGAAVVPRTTIHLHDTFGHAAECVRVALRLGYRSFDGAVGGLGGCPYASTPQSRAPGNIATETLLDVVQAEGFAARVDRERLAQAGRLAQSLLCGRGSA